MKNIIKYYDEVSEGNLNPMDASDENRTKKFVSRFFEFYSAVIKSIKLNGDIEDRDKWLYFGMFRCFMEKFDVNKLASLEISGKDFETFFGSDKSYIDPSEYEYIEAIVVENDMLSVFKDWHKKMQSIEVKYV